MKPDLSATLKPAKKKRIHEKIVIRIRELIAQGELSPGDRLPAERRLAEVFGVSRHAVREAIRTLEQQQIVASKLGDGTYILETQAEQAVEPLASALMCCKGKLAEVLELRKLIEPQIAALAAIHVTKEQLADLREKLDEQRYAIQQGGTGQKEDHDFHKLVAAATGNSLLYSMVISIHDLVAESLEFTLQTDHRRDWAITTHERILEALEARNPDGAFIEMQEHIAYVESLALEQLCENRK